MADYEVCWRWYRAYLLEEHPECRKQVLAFFAALFGEPTDDE